MSLSHKIGKFENILYRHYRVAHGVRIGLAFVITLMAIRISGIPEGSWPLITLVVLLGPMSFWGNVKQRSLHRILGTILGASSGLIALYLELYSVPLMLIWCALVMFFSGYLALGKRPYMAMLIGITLAVVASAEPGDITTALWRAGDVILGAITALLLTSIYPQRAFIHWRLQMSDALNSLGKIYGAYTSINLVERPHLANRLQIELNRVIKMRAFINAASRETHIKHAQFDRLQTVCRDLIGTFELLIESYWASRDGRFWMINAQLLRQTRRIIQQQLSNLSVFLINGSSHTQPSLTQELEELVTQLEQYTPDTQRYQQDAIFSIYGYIWLSRKMCEQIEELELLINSMILTEKPK
ncbi:FUSC family protein [Celerinatantimonas diazotrophica]|uniref:Fusaric acid resistance family protein n=1 Tax=Celerinatantimonas diazotrophica TaxID=412034 RepID=A0A4R1J8P2_9GAMM|nr:FUSC family protein [Celerinatantimonas diazotrophica]TCK46962.1 fusaric acid resistance family protein [Celerinatantimonas diazotrophica]CAG9295730.1 Inner membrane protein YeeA [Celerinatantimonas diazotrophica]